MSKHVLKTRLTGAARGEIVDAFGEMEFGLAQPIRQPGVWSSTVAAVARMSFSPPKAAGPFASNDRNGADSDAEAEDRVRVQELYREFSRSLVRQLTRRTGSRELASDLANETFLRLMRMAPGNVRQIQQPEAYLRRASTNLLQRWRKAEAFRAQATPRVELSVEPLVDQVAVLESRDTLRRLEQAMGKLKPRTREIFMAHRIHGLTYAEIAAWTGLSIKGVEKQMSKAIAKIDRLLDRD